jgi:hypothetical protein
VTTRKCANCPVREATAVLAGSAIRAETRFSRCPKAAKATVYRKAVFRDRNQTIKRTLFTVERRPDALHGVFQSLNRHEFTQNCPNLVLSNRTILTLSCRHPHLTAVDEPAAKFSVLSKGESENLAVLRAKAGGSQLVAGLLDLQAGLLDDAERQFDGLRQSENQTDEGKAFLAKVIAEVKTLKGDL